MAATVHLHIGLPKTATTYLQRVMWSHQDQMRAAGVLLPGTERREHFWASRVVRGELPVPGESPEGDALPLDHGPAWQAGSWERLRQEIADWPGRAVISHEFFGAASRAQAEAMIASLAPAEVHVVVTAREPLGLFAASWQESLKNRATEPLAGYAAEVSDDPRQIWNWRTLDLRLVLDRWAPAGGPVPADHVHVLPLPGAEHPRETIWHRFAGLLGLDPTAYDLGGAFPNESMGVVEAETLRRVNAHLGGFVRAIDKGTFIRTFLADERLVPRRGERFWPADDQVEMCRERGRASVALVRERGFDVVGDLDDLLVPDVVEPRRHPDSVTDAEVAAVATELVARMLDDVRTLRHERRALRDEVAALREEIRERAALPLWRVVGSRAKQAVRRVPAPDPAQE